MKRLSSPPQILNEKLEQRVSVVTICTSLNALFAGNSSTMVHAVVQSCSNSQLGGGAGPAPGGIFGGIMGGGLTGGVCSR
jgi:uncharacterized membrane protein